MSDDEKDMFAIEEELDDDETGNELDEPHVNYVPNSVYLVTTERCNDTIACKGCNQTFGCATETLERRGKQIIRHYPHYDWFKHCYSCMKFAELGLVRYCNSCWSRFLNDDLKKHHSPKCLVVAERNRNLYHIKNPQHCLNVSSLFDRAEVFRVFWPVEDKDEYEKTFNKSFDDGRDLKPREPPEQAESVNENKSANENTQTHQSPAAKKPRKGPEPVPQVSNAVALIPKRRHSYNSMPPKVSRSRQMPTLFVEQQPKYVQELPSSQEDDFYQKCQICKRLFVDLEDHQKKAHSADYRKETLKKEKDFLKEFKSKEKRKCPKCTIKFHSLKDAESHIRAVHECVICPKCSQLFESDHSSSLAGNNYLKHERCEPKYIAFIKYCKAKEMICSFEKYFDKLTDKCRVCESGVKGESQKKRHFIRHIGARYRCMSCSQSYADIQGLKLHNRSKHQGETVEVSENDLYWMLIGEDVAKMTDGI